MVPEASIAEGDVGRQAARIGLRQVFTVEGVGFEGLRRGIRRERLRLGTATQTEAFGWKISHLLAFFKGEWWDNPTLRRVVYVPFGSLLGSCRFVHGCSC